MDSRRLLAALNAQLGRECVARKQSEESLRRSEGLHRALLESLGEGVGLFDAEDRIVFANHALESTLQLSRDELLGKRFSELFLEESGEPLAHGASDTSRPRCCELVLRRSPSVLVLVTETRLDPTYGRDARVLRVVRDYTDRVLSERRQRDLERELQRNQSMQSLAVMAGGVAHDFNNLLCGVVGNAEVAQRKVPANAPVVLSHCLAEIIAFATEAAQLSKQMLAFAGRRSLAIEALDANVELSSALRLLHAAVESKARLVLALDTGLLPVAADRIQLRQVITNLVLNALDAMAGHRGVLTLGTALVRLAGEAAEKHRLPAGDYVKISVEDTGAGIPSEACERLFEPFFSTKAVGRGMGLAAAAGIVRAHRAWLGVDETSELGTRFSVLWPVAHRATPRRASPPKFSRPSAVARRILLIDDEPAVRVVTGRLLAELGHQVLTADTGQRGVEIFRKDPQSIDLVVLDLTMPERSGEQILEDLRLVRDDVPVVITSGFQASDASNLLRVRNVVGFLDKPHTLSNLEMVLAALDCDAAGVSASGKLDTASERSVAS
jgi:two-component system cell cycle sensor histidine kinase/response regulator CckA